jgi:hypothetical protein
MQGVPAHEGLVHPHSSMISASQKHPALIQLDHDGTGDASLVALQFCSCLPPMRTRPASIQTENYSLTCEYDKTFSMSPHMDVNTQPHGWLDFIQVTRIPGLPKVCTRNENYKILQ